MTAVSKPPLRRYLPTYTYIPHTGLMMDVVDPTVKVLWLGRRLALTIGGRDAGMIYGYLFLAGIVARVIMPDFKKMTLLVSTLFKKQMNYI